MTKIGTLAAVGIITGLVAGWAEIKAITAKQEDIDSFCRQMANDVDEALYKANHVSDRLDDIQKLLNK